MTQFLPDGSVARSTKAYVRAWRELARPLCKALGAQLAAFDPGIRLVMPDGCAVELSASVVMKLDAVLSDNCR